MERLRHRGGLRWGGGMGTATSSTITMGTKASPEKRRKNMNKAMEKLLKNFPRKQQT